MKTCEIFTIVALILFVASPALSDTYYIWDTWGGTWADAEKDNVSTDDDLMCWAATAANILEYTGWGNAGGMTNADQIFDYTCGHFIDAGGFMDWEWGWWFDGNARGGNANVDVGGGGNFYPSLTFTDYFVEDWSGWYLSDGTTMSVIDSYLHQGYGTGLAVYDGMAHAITVWGYDYDPANPNYYTGVWITDSDDDKYGPDPRPNTLRYYDVVLSGGRWYLQNFYGVSNVFIGGVQGLAIVPVPGAVLLGILGLGAVGIKLRKYA